MEHQTAPLFAGFAQSEITTDRSDAKIHDPLYAKALVFSQKEQNAVLLSLDAVAIGGICDIGDDFLPTLRSRIQTLTGISGDCVMVTATHTHTRGPMLLPQSALLDRTTEAVLRAYDRRTRVHTGVGLKKETRIAINRTLRLKDGSHETIRQANPCPNDDKIAALGPSDDDVGFLRIDRVDGGLLAVVFNFSCHPLCGVPSGAITANYPGFACSLLQRALRVPALFVPGCLGDRTEVAYKNVQTPTDSESIGHKLGMIVLDGVQGVQTKPAVLRMAHTEFCLPRRTDGPRVIEKLERQRQTLMRSLRFTSLNFKTFLPMYIRYALNPNAPSDYKYVYMHQQAIGSQDLCELDRKNRADVDKYLKNIEAMEKMARIEDQIATLKRHIEINRGRTSVETEASALRIGDFVLIGAPVELCTQVGQNIKRFSPFPHTYIASCTNGYLHYGANAADYEQGGYEVTECMLAPEWQAVYESKARELLGRL